MPVEALLNQTWKSQLAIIGMDGFPKPENAGNVFLPYSIVKLSLRTPPGCDAKALTQKIKQILETNPPYGAEVTLEVSAGRSGWNAPPLAPWLEAALLSASTAHFGKPTAFLGIGGTISFIGLLGKKFPKAQFVVTGALGPDSNNHGPDESLNIPAAKKLSACIAEILAAQANR